MAWAVVWFGLLGLLVGLVRGGYEPLHALDNRGGPALEWAVNIGWLDPILRTIEIIFGTVGMTLATIALALALLLRKQARATAYTLGVMIATTLGTTLLKLGVGRSRPEWQDPIGFLQNNAFPSGHVSAVTAYAGVLIVLGSMFLRRALIRRAAAIAVVLVVLAVSADRVLLGRHYPSDTVGGALTPPAACVTVRVWPAIVSDPSRAPPVLAATV